jgi:hypothetical protein
VSGVRFHSGREEESKFVYKVENHPASPHAPYKLQWTHQRNIDVYCFAEKVVYNIPLYGESELFGNKHCLSITIPISKDGTPERVLF